MRRRNGLGNQGRLVLILDIVAVLASFGLAWLIRSQFRWFVFRPSDALVLCPWIVLLRIVTNLFFDHYGVGMQALTINDLGRLLSTSLLPSVVLMGFRYLFTFSFLRMPLSMILLEYVFSMGGFMIIRVAAHQALLRRSDAPIFHRRRVLLYGEVQELEDERVVARLEEDGRTLVRGILTDNPMHWDDSVAGRRVSGPMEKARAIVAGDDTISGLILHDAAGLSDGRLAAAKAASQALNLEVGFWEDGAVRWLRVDAQAQTPKTD